MTLATESEIIGRMPEHEPMPESGEEIPVARVWHATPPPIPPPFPPPSGYAGTPNYGSYSALYVRPSKPGIITAMGVMSIVVACVSLGACVTSAVQALVEIGFVRVLGQVALNATNRRAVSAAATQASAPSDTGLAFDERQVVLNVWAARQVLSNARLAQLDELLAQNGQVILGLQPGQVTSGKAKGAIQSASRGRSVHLGEIGPDQFTTRSGTLELYEGNGIFRPVDRAFPVVRVAADVNVYLAATNGTQVPSVISPMTSTTTVNSTGISTATTTSIAIPRVSMDPFATTLVFTETVLSALLAAYLFIIGNLVLRGNRLGGWLHLAYAILKLGLIAFCWYGWTKFEASYATAMMSINWGASGALNRGSLINTFKMRLMTFIVISALYPVALLIVLWTKTVREYYQRAKV